MLVATKHDPECVHFVRNENVNSGTIPSKCARIFQIRLILHKKILNNTT